MMKANIFKLIFFACFTMYCIGGYSQDKMTSRTYEIWDNAPAPNRGGDYSLIMQKSYPYDEDWEKESYAIGNGFMGANVFGRTDVERIQITEKTLANERSGRIAGLTNFAEIYLDFNHWEYKNYKRSLNLNTGIINVNYEHDDVVYSREYVANYPENVIAVKLTANKTQKISFTLTAKDPHQRSDYEMHKRAGSTFAKDDLITLKGHIPYFSINYEAQIKVINDGGQLIVNNENENAKIRLENANSVVIIITAGTNYKLSPDVFLEDENDKKLDANAFPNEIVSERISTATNLGFEQLKLSHLQDYQNLFNRVQLNFSSAVPQVTTRALLESYKNDQSNPYLEELMFHYGRYLLISSSREGGLPSGLQGAWSQYLATPWSGGYWHNINVQMNYWGVFSANLAETFTPYLDYFQAYLPKAKKIANEHVSKENPESYDKDTDNGWAIGTSATAYAITSPGTHSGPGTGGFTTKLLWDRYEFTQDTTYLKKVGYPALLSMSKFLSKTLVKQDNGVLLVEPSASPEIRVESEKDKYRGEYYITKGTTFDQGFVWETYNDVLKAGKIIDAKDKFLGVLKNQITKLDPILIGSSGQVKEYREEDKYGEIGDPQHRHVSHLCTLYPGTLINSGTPEWVNGVKVALDYRGNKGSAWAMAHRMNLRARTREPEKALEVYTKFLNERIAPNLWANTPFQIDGNLGAMAGVIEMLVQSHEGFIELLPALPKKWQDGTFNGIIARGNFELESRWENGKASFLKIKAKSGGLCNIKYKNLSDASLKDSLGNQVNFTISNNLLQFNTKKSEVYHLTFK